MECSKLAFPLFVFLQEGSTVTQVLLMEILEFVFIATSMIVIQMASLTLLFVANSLEENTNSAFVLWSSV